MGASTCEPRESTRHGQSVQPRKEEVERVKTKELSRGERRAGTAGVACVMWGGGGRGRGDPVSPLLLVRRDRLSSRSTPLPKPGGGVFSAHFRALHRETDDPPYPVLHVPSSSCKLAFYKTVLIKAFHCLSHAYATAFSKYFKFYTEHLPFHSSPAPYNILG